jgi:serine/threonine protein kinase
MPTLDDIRLGQLSVAQGLCQPPEVEECLALQHRNEQSGATERLGELLVSRGYLTPNQLGRLLNLQREAEQKVTRIGPYDLIRKLGEGGMGAVYQAHDTRDGKVVALKVLPRSRARDKVFVERFEREARAAFELDHPNIVHGLDVGQADGYHFLVMEFVQGHDVYAMLEQRGRLPEIEVLTIMEQIASALDHIHGERLVHRDIKPENIIVTAKGEAKLADMGLAMDNQTQGRRRITRSGIAMGTPFYLSPEQIEGKTNIDIRSDIYALGATVYEMITGRPPFDGETPAVVMMKHLNETVPSPHDIDHAVTLHFCHILEKMMAKDPAERYQSPADLSADIALAKQNQAPVSTRPQSGRSSVSRPQAQKNAERAITPERLPDIPNTLDGAISSSSLKPRSRRNNSHVSAAIGTRSRTNINNSSSSNSAQNRAKHFKYAFFFGLAVAISVLIIVVLTAYAMR